MFEDFVRVSEVGINCPICSKSDWYLISGNNIISNSSGSRIICQYIKERYMGEAGWLHIIRQDPASTISQTLYNLRESILIIVGKVE